MVTRNEQIDNYPVISISEHVYRKIRGFVSICPNEISALGSVSVHENHVLIDDIFLFDQVVSPGSTDLSSEAISKFLVEYIRSGKDPASLKFWWHSHANMGVFWSGVDTGTIDRFNSGWMISMVSNKAGESKLRMDIFDPFRLTMDNLPFSVDYTRLNGDLELKAEIDAKVKPRYSSYMNSLREAIDPYPKHSDPFPKQQEGSFPKPLPTVGSTLVNDSVAARYNNTDVPNTNIPVVTVDELADRQKSTLRPSGPTFEIIESNEKTNDVKRTFIKI
jgi:hypothetical protein